MFFPIILLVFTGLTFCTKKDPVTLEILQTSNNVVLPPHKPKPDSIPKPIPVSDYDLTFGSVTDIDNNIYKTVMIDTLTWMVDNLRTTRYNDGFQIFLGSGGPAGYTDWFNLTRGAYCWYDNDEKNKETYGAIYNWYAVDTKMLCPVGWHVPTEKEWTILVSFLGGGVLSFNENTENGMILWEDSNNIVNHNGLEPADNAFLDGWGFLHGDRGFWWTATPVFEFNVGELSAFIVSFDIKGYEPKCYGYNVRCLKDN